jgi:hypothetical protein
MRWLTESAMHRRRSMISADWKKKRGDFIGAALSDIRLTSAGKRVKASLQLTRHGPGWRATVCMIATEHWPTSGTGTAWSAPWRAMQRAASDALSGQMDPGMPVASLLLPEHERTPRGDESLSNPRELQVHPVIGRDREAATIADLPEAANVA